VTFAYQEFAISSGHLNADFLFKQRNEKRKSQLKFLLLPFFVFAKGRFYCSASFKSKPSLVCSRFHNCGRIGSGFFVAKQKIKAFVVFLSF
jgi:hypothetical protein